MANANAFAGLKRRKTNFDDLAAKFNTNKKSYGDDRFYYPERDDQGNGYAVLRFLHTGVDTPPFVKYYSHKFKGLNGWFWQNCRTTLEKDCPCCELNRATIEPFGSWDATPEREKNIVRNRKRQLYFVSNVYVVHDPKNPENEGKVFLFRYGSKIMDKIKQAIQPEFENDPQFDPFNPWSGANFVLKIRKVKGQTNYDSSSFETPTALFDDDAKIEALASNIYDLDEFVSPDFYQSYEEQKIKLTRVLGLADREAANETKEPAAKAPEVGRSEPTSEAAETAFDDESETDTAQDELDSLFDDPDEDIPF